MPLTKSAIKKMRQDKTREKTNRVKKAALKKVLRSVISSKTPKNLSLAFSSLDKAVKTGLIPKGRADRKKSRLTKLVAGNIEQKTTRKESKTKKK